MSTDKKTGTKICHWKKETKYKT